MATVDEEERAERQAARAAQRADWARENALSQAIRLHTSGHAGDGSVNAIIENAEAFREFLAGETQFVRDSDKQDTADDSSEGSADNPDEVCGSGEEHEGVPISLALAALLLGGKGA